MRGLLSRLTVVNNTTDVMVLCFCPFDISGKLATQAHSSLNFVRTFGVDFDVALLFQYTEVQTETVEKWSQANGEFPVKKVQFPKFFVFLHKFGSAMQYSTGGVQSA